MKHGISRFLLIGTLLTTACNGASIQGEAFSSETGELRVETPAPFEETQQAIQTPVGPVEIHTFTAEAEDSAYVIAYSDYPSAIVEETNPQALLDSSRDGAVTNLGGTLLSEEAVEIDGYPGRSLVISTGAETDEPATISSRIYLVDNRLYQVLVVIPEGKNVEKAAAGFLESFALE